MRFSSVLLAASAFVVAFAQPKFTNSEFGTLTAGQAFVLTWSNAQGPVTITLRNGKSGNLQTVMTVVSGATGNSFSWIPSASLADGSYALEIDDSSNVPNYSPQFQLVGGSGSVTGASSATASATASGTSSATESSAASSSASSAASSAPASSLPPLTTTTTTKSTSSVHTTSTSSLTSSARPSVHNTTTTSSASSTGSSTGSSTSSSSTSSSTPPPNNNNAAGLASPLAFVFLAFAALLTLN